MRVEQRLVLRCRAEYVNSFIIITADSCMYKKYFNMRFFTAILFLSIAVLLLVTERTVVSCGCHFDKRQFR